VPNQSLYGLVIQDCHSICLADTVPQRKTEKINNTKVILKGFIITRIASPALVNYYPDQQTESPAV
ncbi:hypothetical protein, partial [Escherichia coli]|uniref:hypothetical protein n=1 Tax=Escherichia coli TaxID=562 RepID=UPI001BDC086E